MYLHAVNTLNRFLHSAISHGGFRLVRSKKIRHVNDYPSGNQENEEWKTARYAEEDSSGTPISVPGSVMAAVAALRMSQADPTDLKTNATVGEEPTRGKLDTTQIKEYYEFRNRNNMCELQEVVLPSRLVEGPGEGRLDNLESHQSISSHSRFGNEDMAGEVGLSDHNSPTQNLSKFDKADKTSLGLSPNEAPESKRSGQLTEKEAAIIGRVSQKIGRNGVAAYLSSKKPGQARIRKLEVGNKPRIVQDLSPLPLTPITHQSRTGGDRHI